MCGIVGEYRFDGAGIEPQVLRAMMEVQRHRGPDDQGAWLFSLRSGRGREMENVEAGSDRSDFEGSLGFNRLSILDLSANGHQPMTNEDASVIVVFNGEAYNAADYRSELESAGFRFRSTTDTEVVLRLYERYGITGTLERLNGMFALCIADLRTRELLLARDRLGIKPLYWCDMGRTFLFASEVKSFLQHPSFDPVLDMDRMPEFLTFRYCSGEGSLLRGVRSMEPGTWMRIRPHGREVRRYWTLPDRNGERVLHATALAGVEERIRGSVRRQLWSDVKLGCQLSGGIDSSLVNLLAARAAGTNLDAYSIGFAEKEFDEGPWIERAAARAGVRVHRYLLDAEYFQRALETATWHLDQPMGHPNSVGIYRLAENARADVTVLLSGEGADELFGGYTRFLKARIHSRIASGLPILGRLPVVGGRVADMFGEGEDPVGWFLLQTAFLDPSRLRRLFPDGDMESALASRRTIFAEGKGDFLANCLRYELRTYLVDLLLRQDKMTMAHSMENRVPYLDNDLVEYVRRLPSDYLVTTNGNWLHPKSHNTKALLKKLALRYFDPEFVYRPKQGFVIPLRSYFLAPPMRVWLEDAVLPAMYHRGVVQGNVVERWWRDLIENRPAPHDALWICIAFEIWAQRFLDVPSMELSPHSDRRAAR